MPMLDRLRRDRPGPDLVESMTRDVEQLLSNEEMLSERIAELELALEDVDYLRVTGEASGEFSRDGLRKIADLCRLAWLKNPLIRRGVNVKSFYVFGQGITIVADDEQVNQVLADHMDNLGNRAELYDHQARLETDQELTREGNLFFALFTDSLTGTVRCRSIPAGEVEEIICDPDDRQTHWYYLRVYTHTEFDPASGITRTSQRKAYYPAVWYRPSRASRPRQINGWTVMWDAPVMHVRVGGTKYMKFGVPEVYPALDWARAYKEFLEDWASLVRALSKFAWRWKGKGRNLGAAKTKLNTKLDQGVADSNPPPTVGSVALVPAGQDLEPIPKSGATIAVEDGKPMRLMVAAAMELPDTILSGDPDQGNLATAKTLDRPTELAMLSRQQLWKDVHRDLATYVIAASIEAPRGPLDGRVILDGDNLSVEVQTSEGLAPPLVEVTFPPILEQDVPELIQAAVLAATLDGKGDAGTIPPQALSKWLMTALDFDSVEELLEELEQAREQADADAAAADPEAAEVAEALAEVTAAARTLIARYGTASADTLAEAVRSDDAGRTELARLTAELAEAKSGRRLSAVRDESGALVAFDVTPSTNGTGS